MLVVGYFTVGTPYEAIGLEFRSHLESLGIEHDVRAVPNLGSWQRNTQFKPRFIRQIMRELARPMVYIDVDAEIVAPPILLENLDCDIAAARFDRCELLSGTVYFNPTPATIRTVDRWIALCEQYPEKIPAGFLPHYAKEDFAWDQRLLDRAIRDTGARFTELPPEYTFIHDLSREKYPGLEPIILHGIVSRKYRDTIHA